jgi:universal stress protein E
MRPIRRILVAIRDPGANFFPTVAKAARLASACGAHVELFHSIKAAVYANTPAGYEKALLELHETQRQQYLQRLGRIATRLRLHRINVATAVEYDYPPHDAIIRRACLIKADLIVAGIHGEGHSAAGLLHLTDWELLRHSPVPVLLVKRSPPYRHPNILAAVDPARAHSKPSQLDEEILSMGSAIADALRGKLHAVHAYAPIVVGSAAASIPDAVAVRLEGIAAADAGVRLERALQTTRIPRTRRHLVGNLPAAAIREVARRTHSNIVVMGALSRSGLKRLIIGNTAERLFDELPCDLLIVKPAQFVSGVPSLCRGPRLVARSG